jgi:hypothetical protein
MDVFNVLKPITEHAQSSCLEGERRQMNEEGGGVAYGVLIVEAQPLSGPTNQN